MSSRSTVIVVTAAGVMADFAARCSQVALPLIALAWTGHAASAGLVAGAMAIPVVLSPWWTRRLRERVTSGTAIAVVTGLQAVAMLLLPLAALAGLPGDPSLVVVGILVGATRTLLIPGRQALVADLDQRRTGSAEAVLAWQEAASRATIILGPAVGALVVGAGYRMELIVAEAVILLVAAVLTATVRARPVQVREVGAEPDTGGMRLREALRGEPEILRGWIIRGLSCVVWFAFALGLAIDSAHGPHPGLNYAIGVGGFGIGAMVATVWAGTSGPPQGARRRRLPTLRPSLRLAAGGWLVNGAAWMLIGIWSAPALYGVGGLVAGLGSGIGFATITRLVAIRTSGPQRRTLLSGQQMVVEATTAVGMLVGGAVIGAIGTDNSLLASGGILIAAAVLWGGWIPARRTVFHRAANTDNAPSTTTAATSRDRSPAAQGTAVCVSEG